MTNRRTMLKTMAAVGAAARAGVAVPQNSPENDREYWVRLLGRIAEPVLVNLARGTLKREMPVECVTGDPDERRKFSHLEAIGRLLAGIAPWLETPVDDGAERKLQERYRGLAREALASGTDPGSPDFLNFSEGSQPVVDAAFLAQAILRAPNELWGKLDTRTRRNLVAALISSRVIVPGYNNWLLFSAMVEAGLALMEQTWDGVRIDYAIRKHREWYLGDGIYGDGPQFHWDYYNSFVIQPMLLDVLRQIGKFSQRWQPYLPEALERARRYAAIQERLIAPDGTFPSVGRSTTYRCGAFQLLARQAFTGELPKGITGPQVRSALTAVMRRQMEAPGTFDSRGWLQIGFCGHQPHLGEPYISTGSLYLCATALLPLGLPAADGFWSGPAEDWTSRRLWHGQDAAADHAIQK
jgi:hypothetical protein